MKSDSFVLKTGKVAAKTGYKAGALLLKSVALLTKGLAKGVQEAYEETKEKKAKKEKA